MVQTSPDAAAASPPSSPAGSEENVTSSESSTTDSAEDGEEPAKPTTLEPDEADASMGSSFDQCERGLPLRALGAGGASRDELNAVDAAGRRGQREGHLVGADLVLLCKGGRLHAKSGAGDTMCGRVTGPKSSGTRGPAPGAEFCKRRFG